MVDLLSNFPKKIKTDGPLPIPPISRIHLVWVMLHCQPSVGLMVKRKAMAQRRKKESEIESFSPVKYRKTLNIELKQAPWTLFHHT